MLRATLALDPIDDALLDYDYFRIKTSYDYQDLTKEEPFRDYQNVCVPLTNTLWVKGILHSAAEGRISSTCRLNVSHYPLSQIRRQEQRRLVHRTKIRNAMATSPNHGSTNCFLVGYKTKWILVISYDSDRDSSFPPLKTSTTQARLSVLFVFSFCPLHCYS